ncbi:hypothetical protein TNCV_3794691 [Trichonephila clavipes]|nr:hypothetical protein TNCV_3794691 [Trichonephila clavipes]
MCVRVLNPLTGYLPPEELFRKRLTLILRFPSKNATDFFPFQLLELGRSNGDNFTTQFGPFVKTNTTRKPKHNNDNDDDDIDNKGSSDDDVDYGDASLFLTLLRNENTYFKEK